MKPTTAILVLVAALAGAVFGIVGSTFVEGTRSTSGAQAQTSSERKVLYWHDPMVPGHKFDKPGKSPFMDMDLVPVYADEVLAEEGDIVTIRPEVANNLGVRTAPVVRSRAPRRLEADGYAFRDERGAGVLADILAPDAGWVRRGLAAEVRFPELGSESHAGTVSAVLPDVELGARSFRAQIRLVRPPAAIRPNLYAQVSLVGAFPAQPRLLVPREALIRTGSRTSVVLALDAGRFKPVEVVAGAEIGEQVEILNGLSDGDRVVTSGQFLLDSEASVRASFTRMESEGEAAAPDAAAHSSHSSHAGH